MGSPNPIISTAMAVKNAVNLVTVRTGGGGGSCPIATANTPGMVRPDGTTIAVLLDGTISVIGGGGNVTGGVSSFNGRTGNITMTSNDVMSTATQYSQPVYDAVMQANFPKGGTISGSDLIRGMKLDKIWSNQTSQYYYGFFGMGFGSNFYAGVVEKATNNITSMMFLRPGKDSMGGFELIAGEKSILVSPNEISFVGNTGIGGIVYCQTSYQFGNEPAFNEVLTREAGDTRYMRKTRAN